mgnify:CR=1 FL=1|jgi:hypothetical protein
MIDVMHLGHSVTWSIMTEGTSSEWLYFGQLNFTSDIMSSPLSWLNLNRILPDNFRVQADSNEFSKALNYSCIK